MRWGVQRPKPPKVRTGKKIAVIGSPARPGWLAADQLNKRGHNVTVFERNDRVGGLLTLWYSEYEAGKAESLTGKSTSWRKKAFTFVTNANVGEECQRSKASERI